MCRGARNLLKAMLEVFVHRNAPPFMMRYGPVTSETSLAAAIPFVPFEEANSHQLLVPVLASIVISLPAETLASQIDDVGELAEQLLALAEKPHTDEALMLTIRKCLASIVNKAGHLLGALVEEELTLALSQRARSSPHSLHVYYWIVKGLIMRRHPQSVDLIQDLCSFLNPANNANADIAPLAAAAYDTILRSFDDVLNKDCHAIVNVRTD